MAISRTICNTVEAYSLCCRPTHVNTLQEAIATGKHYAEAAIAVLKGT